MKFKTFLILIILGSIWPCEGNESCTATNSYCLLEEGKCACNNFEQTFSSNFEKCLPAVLYGDKCEDSNQCNLMPSGASCKEGVCQCQDGFTYVRGKCRKLSLLNDHCDEVSNLILFYRYKWLEIPSVYF